MRAAEAQEQSVRAELQELLGAHDDLQGKWRKASKDIAVQSQRCIEVYFDEFTYVCVYVCACVCMCVCMYIV